MMLFLSWVFVVFGLTQVNSLKTGFCKPGQRDHPDYVKCPQKSCRQHIDCWVSFGQPQSCVCDPNLCGPVCLPESAKCPKPNTPEHGTVRLSGLGIGETAEYSCKDGMTIKGPRTRHCLATLQWSGSNPRCTTQSNYCFSPPYIPNTLIQPADPTRSAHRDDYRSGEVITITCAPGFKDDRWPSVKATCVNSDWSFDRLKCERVSCPELRNPLHGKIVYKSDRGYQAEVVTICQEGFRANCDEASTGSGAINGCARVCQANGSWSGVETKCLPVICPKLKPPQHGRLSSSATEVHSIVELECDRGFESTGTLKVRCLTNGQWDMELATCRVRDCGRPHDVKNGKVIFENTTFGSEATIKCEDGTTPSSTGTRLRCGISGNRSTWLPEPTPTCDRHCYLFTVENGDVVLIHRDNTSGEVLIPIKTDKSRWKQLGQEFSVHSLSDVILRGGMVRHDSKLNVTCHFGYQLARKQPPTTTCMDGVWSVRSKCIPASCGTQPPIIRNARARFYSTAHGSKARYECYTGYRLQVNATQSTIHASLHPGPRDTLGIMRCLYGKWTGIPIECALVYCSKLSVDEPLRVHYEPSYLNTNHSGNVSPHGTIARFVCMDGLFLIGSEFVVCQNGKWTPTPNAKCSKVEPFEFWRYSIL